MKVCFYCAAAMTGPKYRDDGFRYFHCYECPMCRRTFDEQRPHAEWEANQRAMRGLDVRDCENINVQDGAWPGEGFNYGMGR